MNAYQKKEEKQKKAKVLLAIFFPPSFLPSNKIMINRKESMQQFSRNWFMSNGIKFGNCKFK